MEWFLLHQTKSTWQTNHLKMPYPKLLSRKDVQARHLKSEVNRSDVISKKTNLKSGEEQKPKEQQDGWHSNFTREVRLSKMIPESAINALVIGACLHLSWLISIFPTVDGRNPKQPPGMVKTL